MKIAIIGYSGAGKSTLAEKLSNYYSIPKLHMDTLQFQPGWQDSDREWMLTEMKTFSQNTKLGSSMAITLGAMKKKNAGSWPNYLSQFFPMDLLTWGPLSVISNTKEKSEKVWQQAVLNALTGILSDGFSGMGGQRMLKNAINGFKKLPWESNCPQVAKEMDHFLENL